MIKREELKVDSIYIRDQDYISIIVNAIGKSNILYQYKEDDSEYSMSMDRFLRTHSLAPKPKKKIKLNWYMSDDPGKPGIFIYKDSWCPGVGWKLIKSEEIEVEDV